MSGLRGVEDDGASGVDLFGLAAVHHVRGQEAEAGVTMMLVVGVEELDAEPACVLEGLSLIHI